jgi:DNA polymerase
MTTSGIEIDVETRSKVNLKTEDLYAYYRDPSTDVLLASYKISGGRLGRWRRGQPCPPDLREAIERGDMITAHKAAFERKALTIVLHEKHGWPKPKPEQFRCTQATAAAMGLPQALEALGDALQLTTQKSKEGTALINFFSKPKRDGTFNEPEDFPEKFDQFHDYCDQDVETEACADAKMVSLPDFEQRFYSLQEKINDRGIRVDITSLHAAIELSERALKKLNKEISQITGNAVKAVTNVDRLVEWVEAQGVPLSSGTKADIEQLLELDDLPKHVRRAVEIRQQGAKTSVAKLKKMLKLAGPDGRIRGAFIYHKASTGRTQSVGVNLNNLPRPRRIFDDAKLRQDVLFNAIRTGDPDALTLLYGDELGKPMLMLSDAIRGFIWAAPGMEFMQADYSGIEGAVIAWSSDELWKLREMFAIIEDPDNRPDLYRQTAASILNLTTDVVTKKHWARQAVGKVSELALGFGGGVAAFYSMSLNYSVKLDPLFEPVWQTADEERREKAVKRYMGCLKRGKERTDLLSREAWIACELIKVGWRLANPKIAAGWQLREQAVRDAIRNPGTIYTALKFKYVVKMGYLWCLLPSGRALCYASPKLKSQVWAKIKLDDGSFGDAEVMLREEAEKLALKGLVKIQGDTSPAITCLGVDKSGKKMQREMLYGGILAENDTQAVARDLLVNGMWIAEEAGYPIVLTVYDEMVAEVPRGWGDLKEFEKMICELPDWAEGMPLTAGGWRGKRYRKD